MINNDLKTKDEPCTYDHLAVTGDRLTTTVEKSHQNINTEGIQKDQLPS